MRFTFYAFHGAFVLDRQQTLTYLSIFITNIYQDYIQVQVIIYHELAIKVSISLNMRYING